MAPEVVIELEHYGMPFDRNENGTIYQRPFGGHSANFGEKPVQRACAAAEGQGSAPEPYRAGCGRAHGVERQCGGDPACHRDRPTF